MPALLPQRDDIERATAILFDSLDEYLDGAQRIEISAGGGSPPEVSIHHVRPPTLNRLEGSVGDTTGTRDADSILRYVAVEREGIDFTWYRR